MPSLRAPKESISLSLLRQDAERLSALRPPTAKNAGTISFLTSRVTSFKTRGNPSVAKSITSHIPGKAWQAQTTAVGWSSMLTPHVTIADATSCANSSRANRQRAAAISRWSSARMFLATARMNGNGGDSCVLIDKADLRHARLACRCAFDGDRQITSSRSDTRPAMAERCPL